MHTHGLGSQLALAARWAAGQSPRAETPGASFTHPTLTMQLLPRLTVLRWLTGASTLLLPVLVPTLVAAAIGATGTASAQSETLGPAAQGVIVNRVAELLEERYVFPEMAQQCADGLRGLVAQGELKEARSPEDLGSFLTEAIRKVSQDKHLLVRLRARPEGASPGQGKPVHPLRKRAQLAGRAAESNFGFERVERLDGNIGYLDLRYFANPPEAISTAAAAMDFLANTDALIFDMRQNGGGSPGMVHFLCSYLFTERIHLNSFYYREGDRTEDYFTLEGVPGRQRPDVPVFVLTSASTFSGAEEFSYNLSTQKRATLVGETTRGGAHPGNLFPINDQLEIFIPIGRAINPITGTNWEGVGVKPHVPVPADEALEAALELARPAGEAHRLAKAARWAEFEAAYDWAVLLDDEKQPEAAAAALKECLHGCRVGGLLDESGINLLGYDLLAQGRTGLAVAALGYNVATFPNSANAYDSFGEALRARGDRVGALKNYERALELDPKGRNAEAARAVVAELKAELAKGGEAKGR